MLQITISVISAEHCKRGSHFYARAFSPVSQSAALPAGYACIPVASGLGRRAVSTPRLYVKHTLRRDQRHPRASDKRSRAGMH